jgi:hypothetical protein
MNAPVCILLYGHDTTILKTRCWILERARFEVQTANILEDLKRISQLRSLKLLILCHTLSLEECKEAVSITKALQPKTRVLVLTTCEATSQLRNEHEVLSILEGPRALAATVRRMVYPGRAEVPIAIQNGWTLFRSN